MLHEQLARERQNWQDELTDLKHKLTDMESDFSKCARGISSCFFCANDQGCDGNPETCHFKWKTHN